MGKKILTCEDIEIEINNLAAVKVLFCFKKIQNVLVSSKISACEKSYKHFIGYFYDDNEIKPLHIMLPKTGLYLKNYDGQTKWMYFLFEDYDLLEKYDIIWDKVSRYQKII